MTSPLTFDQIRYTYRVTAAQVVDGDTFRLTLDPGFRLTTVQPVRLDGWDCPEKHPVAINRPGIPSLQPEVTAALQAEEFARTWLEGWLYNRDNATVWCRTRKDPDSFGRWLGTVYITDTTTAFADLGMDLQRAGLAVTWPKRWWQEYLK